MLSSFIIDDRNNLNNIILSDSYIFIFYYQYIIINIICITVQKRLPPIYDVPFGRWNDTRKTYDTYGNRADEECRSRGRKMWMSRIEKYEASPKRKHRNTISIRWSIRCEYICAAKETSIAQNLSHNFLLNLIKEIS